MFSGLSSLLIALGRPQPWISPSGNHSLLLVWAEAGYIQMWMNALKTAGLQKSPFLVTLTGVVVGVTVVLSLVLRCPLELFLYKSQDRPSATQAACRRALTYMWGVRIHKQQPQCLSCAPVSNFQTKFGFVCRTVWDPAMLLVLWNLSVTMVQTMGQSGPLSIE